MIRHALFAISLLIATAPLYAADQVVMFSATSYTFHENDGTGAVTVNRIGDPTVSFSVNYNAFVNGVNSLGALSFGPNEMSKAISLVIPNDNVFDQFAPNNQGYYVILQSKPGVTLGAISATTIHLIEDEPQPTVSITSIAVPEGNSGPTDVHLQVTLSVPLKYSETIYSFATGGTATLNSDYEGGYPNSSQFLNVFLAPGQTSAEIIVRIHGDMLSEPDETIFVTATIARWQAKGIITILNDDYLLSPASQQIMLGTVGSLSVTTTLPTATTDRLMITSSDTSVATVPPFIDIPAGSLGKSFDVTTVGNGSAIITIATPPSRGSQTISSRVDVYTTTIFTFDKAFVDLNLAQTTTATAHFDPPPKVPVVLFLLQTNPAVVSLPSVFTIGTDGVGTFLIRATGFGVTVVTATEPAVYGGSTTGFRIQVAPAAGVAITRLDTTSGPSSGGQHVTIYGNGMSTRCAVMFDGVSGLNTSTSTSGFLTTNTPPHDAGTVDVSVRCGDNTGTLPKQYTYTSVPSHLTRLSPTIGPTGGGVLVAATGENFRHGRCSLWFDGASATTIQNDQTTSLLAVAPPHAPGSVDVTMRCGSDVSTLAGGFLYTSGAMLPQVAGVDPPSGAPGDRIIVAGSSLRDDDAVFFDSVAGLDVTSTSDAHFVTVPDLPPGSATITLRDVAGNVAAGSTFRVLAAAAPQITTAPARLLTSSEFPIAGTGFRRSLSFLLGGTVLQPVAVASTYAQLRLPASITPGSYPLTIAGSTATPRTIDVTDGIAVTSVSIPCSST
ncbi:MAG TPA: IPT/TIG domain-containing protein, partial [Thermoanaerobaculia bacterium]|nr:IPT/TIG domain-containing protein [Thermoanaerobaculia bacterium]